MATVYLGRLVGFGGFQRFVAIKRLHPHLAREAEFIDMFLDEARLAARIHHPNVVPIIEVGTSDRGYYLVMEYIEGDTAARLFARSAQEKKRVSPGVGIRIVLDALAGLHAAHELRADDNSALEIVHRDVSPQNILVGVDGIARLTDFGVAKAASRLSTTKSGQLKGKLAYMAPEQARGVKLDRRADLFAMGIVLWETLAFKRLFKGEGEADTLNRVLYEPIPSLCAVAPQVPAELGEVVMKALEREPDARYATAQAFAEALEAVARKLNLLATPKDVAASVDEVIGTEIETQREQVRAWIANSEPSQNTRSAHPESITRIEGRAPPGEEDSMPDGSDPRMAGKTPSGRSLPPSDVSSVSSAVIQVPPPRVPGLSERPSQIPEARQRKVWAVVLPLVFVLGLGGGLGVVRLRSTDSRGQGNAPTSATPREPQSAGPKASEAPTAEPSPKATADLSPSASVAPVESAQVKKGKPVLRPITGTKPGTKPTVQPASTGPAPTVPDDISINPYR